MRPDNAELLEQVRDGATYRELGGKYGVNASTICRWLAETPEIEQQSARAREDSAEAWLDRGLAVVESALRKDAGIDASAARAYAQECARRAAIRNPTYRDGHDVTSGGKPLPAPVAPVFNVTLTEEQKEP